MKKQWVFSTTDDTEMVLPSAAFDLLPFAWESVADWVPDCDLHRFLKELLAPSGYEATADILACDDLGSVGI